MTAKELSRPALARLHDALARHLTQGELAGLVAAVARGGDTHMEVMGTMRIGSPDPIRRDTIFRI